MRRLFVLGAIVVGLFLAFGVTGGGGLQTLKRAEATETTTTWMYPTSGGILVSAGQPSEGTAIFQPAACTNCIITRIEPDLVYQNDSSHADGVTANYNNNNSLDGAWLHHMVIVNACSPPPNYVQIFASGNERSTAQAPAGFGYSQTCASGWHVNWHIHNNGTADRHVALKLVVTYHTGETLTQTTPLNLSVSTADDAEYTVPEGYSDTETQPTAGGGIAADWTSNIQGKIVAMGGHVHDYGISVAVFNNRLNDYICTSTAGYGTGSRYLPTGGPGTPGHPAAGNAVTLNQSYHEPSSPPDDRYHIQAMSGCAPTAAQSILCVGDVLRLHTQYNNTSGFPVFDAMGIMAGSVDTSLPDSNANGTIDACEDNDADGLRNSADNCPDWANPLQDMPFWVVPSGDTDCDGYHNTTAGPAGRAPEPSIGTMTSQHCAATPATSDEALPDAWPVDYNDNQLVNGADVLTFNPHFGQAAPPASANARWDLNASGLVNGADVLQFNPFFGKRCKPLP